MNKKILIIIVAVIIAIAGIGGFIYLTYIADYTYEDDRIKITVPAQTQFNVSATPDESGFSKITYNSTNNEKKIGVKLIKVPDTTIFGTNVKDLTINLMKQQLENLSYKSVKITNNYTIYYNQEEGRYNALIILDNFDGFVLIGCDGSLEDITNLAESFQFISYTTEGLELIEETNATNMTNNTNASSNAKKSTIKNNSSEEDRSNWGKEDYLAHGYGNDVSEQDDYYYEDGGGSVSGSGGTED